MNACSVRRFALTLVLFAIAAPLAAQSGSTLRGHITGPGGTAVRGALVIKMSPTVDTTRADTTGQYAVTRIPAGHYVYQVHATGYEPIEMELTLTNDTTLDVDVPLEVTVGVPASAGNLEQVGFNRRKAENRARGVVFIGPDEIAAKHPEHVTDLLRGINGIEIRPQSRYSEIWGDGARCAMPVDMNGQQALDIWPYQSNRGIDEAVPVTTVMAIEVYPRDSQVPRDFQRPPAPMPTAFTVSVNGSGAQDFDTRTPHCGIILIWTR